MMFDLQTKFEVSRKSYWVKRKKIPNFLFPQKKKNNNIFYSIKNNLMSR